MRKLGTEGYPGIRGTSGPVGGPRYSASSGYAPDYIGYPERSKYKWSKIIIIIKGAVIGFIIPFCISINLNSTFLELRVPIKSIVAIGLGLFIGVSLIVLESAAKSFLTKRRFFKEGLIKCKTCSGEGYIPTSSKRWWLGKHREGDIQPQRRCNICEGKGYIDWVKNVVHGESEYYGKGEPEQSP